MSWNPIEVMDKFGPEDLDKGPIAVLSITKFRKNGGEEAYKRYLKECFTKDVTRPVGGDYVYLGRFAELLQGDIGEWDFLMLVFYPNRRAMYEMINSKAYQEVHHLREDATERAVLYVTDAVMPVRTFSKEATVSQPWLTFE